MQLKQLQHFLAVIDHLTISAAAKSQYVTQSALSRSIMNLEEALNVKLLERGHYGITPTAYGEAFAQRARVIVNESNQALGELDAMRSGSLGRVRLGLAGSVATESLAASLSALMARRPELSLSLNVGFGETHLGMLERGELDAIVTLRPRETTDRHLTFERVVDVLMPVIARATHPLARLGKRVTADHLAKAQWVIYNQPRAEEFHRALMKRAAAGPNALRVHCNTPTFIKYLILKGDYLALLAQPVVAQELESGTLVRLATEFKPVAIELYIVTRTASALPTGVRIALDIIRSHIIELMKGDSEPGTNSRKPRSSR